jgi:hypothetical protein
MPRLAVGLLLALLAFAAPAGASDYYGGGKSHGSYGWRELPPCDHPRVLGSIVEKFAYADANMLYTGLGITSIDAVHETKEKYGHGLIDRRYCRGTAWMTNGRKYEAAWLIESKQGFVGLGWNVESCLPKFDPWRVYDAWCRSIRP